MIFCIIDFLHNRKEEAMNKKLLIGITAFLMTVMAFYGGTVAHAQTITCPGCGSDDVEIWKSTYEKYTTDQHMVTYEYTCWDCGQEGTLDVAQDHNWKVRSDDEYVGTTTCVFVSPTKHKKHLSYLCKECDTRKDMTLTVNHTYQNGGCKFCTYPKNNRTLQSGVRTCFSGRPWMRILIRKPGYLSFRGTGFYTVHDRTRKKYKNEMIDPGAGYGTDFLPVKKGTYYIRCGVSGGNRALKATFYPLKNKKNYSAKKALPAKKNKMKAVTIFAGAKKKTWTRWYKIRLTKKKKLRLWKSGGKFTVYKGDQPVTMNYVKHDRSLHCYVSEKKMDKGTYFICFYDSWNTAERKRTLGEFIRFRWN